MLMLIGLTAVFLRFYQLGTLPPGLYRDEAFNGLDAVRVLHGEHPLFFPANNGREPTYIYLVAAAIGLLGQTAVAVRLPAAVIGSLTTWVVYKLADSWFGRGVGLLTAWLWATTFWPVHLGRIGLRVGMLVPLLALTFWLATLAHRRPSRWLWLVAGAVYGLSFYTYLAARFTPVLLLAALFYLLWGGGWRRLWPGVGWFVVATAVILLPLLLLAWQNPALVLGRTGQVSVLNPAINGGDLLGTLWRKGWQALGMFVWRGDPIVRHNGLQSSGGNCRSVFDLFMAVPFLLGVVVCLRQWRQPLSPLTLALDACHVGVNLCWAEDTPTFSALSGCQQR
ncbi:MAG: glycosyltransferase family 39 protein [Ardenticatenaceae bacterium]|nr:glycosyltransferase family 39 protein [Ardenticatenaceae bacterium]